MDEADQFWMDFIESLFSVSGIVCQVVLRSIRFRPQIIHCHDMFVLPLAVVVKLLTGARLIYDAHELESDRNGLSNRIKNLFSD